MEQYCIHVQVPDCQLQRIRSNAFVLMMYMLRYLGLKYHNISNKPSNTSGKKC